MERAKNLKPIASDNSARAKNRICIIVIFLFHLVGLTGFIIPSLTVLFIALVPWHLLLMLAVIIYSYDSMNGRFLLFAVITFIAGFMAEYIGVHTGLIFGHYEYGGTLGTKLFEIPLMIGVNWFLLIYAAGVTLQRSRLKSALVRILSGAMILTLLDVLIEPIAIQFDYWHWLDAGVPFKNYVCWFVLSALLLFIFEQFKFKRQSIAAPALLIAQFVFFAVLNFVY
ncbi:carotenoid biosynthesis protein [Mucilaginibacter sp. cycad4]|uniref:carotenoid biosynthesis protein n=1 Tax=Mucilaginibacter sp. cycad4 TaxID=3342096 RepID=UPI002AAB76BA|nr:carotenoid biosynthesis protein [Mucilaginibacter gossypii]WPV00132.1 carotenoid biosynthesis protein [Mucilaginibacter gossypii]